MQLAAFKRETPNHALDFTAVSRSLIVDRSTSRPDYRIMYFSSDGHQWRATQRISLWE